MTRHLIYCQVEFIEVGTALTNQHYLATSKGEIYGLDHTASRFNAAAGTDSSQRPKLLHRILPGLSPPLFFMLLASLSLSIFV